MERVKEEREGGKSPVKGASHLLPRTISCQSFPSDEARWGYNEISKQNKIKPTLTNSSEQLATAFTADQKPSPEPILAGTHTA